MRSFITAVSVVCVLMGSGVTGCTRKHMSVFSTADWPHLSSGAYVTEQGRLLYGVGSASGLRSTTLLRVAADNQARREISRLIKSFYGQLLRAAQIDPVEDRTQEMVSALTDTALQHAAISDHQFDTSGGVLYALCSLELSALKQVIQNAAWPDPSLRQRMLAQADTIFADLAARQP